MTELLILLAISLAVSAVGWKYFIYFFSLGYGYGVAVLAVAMAAMHTEALTASTCALCALLFVFGCRLGTYLLVRERRAAAYRKILYDPQLQTKKPVGALSRLATLLFPGWCSLSSRCSRSESAPLAPWRCG